jgi:hypothetical protein
VQDSRLRLPVVLTVALGTAPVPSARLNKKPSPRWWTVPAAMRIGLYWTKHHSPANCPCRGAASGHVMLVYSITIIPPLCQEVNASSRPAAGKVLGDKSRGHHGPCIHVAALWEAVHRMTPCSRRLLRSCETSRARGSSPSRAHVAAATPAAWPSTMHGMATRSAPRA